MIPIIINLSREMHMIVTGNNYLNDNPIEWLLDASDPSIRYHTRREILNEPTSDSDYDDILRSPAVSRLCPPDCSLLGTAANIDLFYKGSIWCFAEAVERGLDRRTRVISNTAEFILSTCQTSSGGFSLSWNPRIALACRTGDMIRYLIRAGYRDERISRGIEWIIRNQRWDGGWLHCPLAGICDQLKLVLLKKPGGGLRREKDPGVTSCFYATIACAMALVEYSQTVDHESLRDGRRKASEFFLTRSLFKNTRNEPVATRTSWNRDFRLLGYPVLSQYDILYGLLFIARAGFFNDGRTGEAFNLIMSKQNNDGTWNMENSQTGMMIYDDSMHREKERSKWVTLQVLRLLTFANMTAAKP
jgi:hypothetical protein